MAKGDATDHALKTIASILHFGEAHRNAEKEANRAPEKPVTVENAPSTAPVAADGYFKVGPGPMDAIRFKWTVRRAENDEYFVDETIGEAMAPVVLGPMTKDAAVKLVDDRESDARQRFEQIRTEMIQRAERI